VPRLRLLSRYVTFYNVQLYLACVSTHVGVSPFVGPGSSYSKPTDSALCPKHFSDYSFIVFECKYPGKLSLPFRMLGDCPVVVTAILTNSLGAVATVEGTLVDLQGPHAEWLHAFGLVPALGDVIVAVDGTVVTHLNSNQCKRLVKRKRTEIRSFLSGRAFVDLNDEPMITVTFRRHFLEVLRSPLTLQLPTLNCMHHQFTCFCRVCTRRIRKATKTMRPA
jgi:hypothetical protein